MSGPNKPTLTKELDNYNLNLGAFTQTPLKTTKTKRLAEGQLSAEKTTQSKIPKTNLFTTSPLSPLHATPSHIKSLITNAISPPKLNMDLASDTDTRPKPLRIPNKDIGQLPCIHAEATTQAILRRDAPDPIPDDHPPTFQQSFDTLTNAFLNNKHLFNIDITTKIHKTMIDALPNNDTKNTKLFQDDDIINDMVDFARAAVIKVIETRVQKRDIFEAHLEEAKSQLAANISGGIPDFIKEISKTVSHFILAKNRMKEETKSLITLNIITLNFDNHLETLLRLKVPLSITHSSVASISARLQDTHLELNAAKTRLNNTENSLNKAAERIGHLKSNEQETRFKDTENQIRLHNINKLGEGTINHFRVLSDADQTKKIETFIQDTIKINSKVNISIFKPRQNGKKFEPLALITFKTAAEKYNFESTFAEHRRNHPSEKLSISRPQPAMSKINDLEHISDIKRQIGQIYNSKILDTIQNHNPPNFKFKELTNEEIQNIQVNIKTKQRPFASYYEFLDPSNGTTYIPFTVNKDPFADHDFTLPIPNPITRRTAASDNRYNKRFPIKIYKK